MQQPRHRGARPPIAGSYYIRARLAQAEAAFFGNPKILVIAVPAAREGPSRSFPLSVHWLSREPLVGVRSADALAVIPSDCTAPIAVI